MSDQLIITLGREFGSGGHAIAVELANRYGIKLYDHNLLDATMRNQEDCCFQEARMVFQVLQKKM